MKELAVSHRQAHDDLVNSDFLKLTSKALPKCSFILLSKITYREYKCSILLVIYKFDCFKPISNFVCNNF